MNLTSLNQFIGYNVSATDDEVLQLIKEKESMDVMTYLEIIGPSVAGGMIIIFGILILIYKCRQKST